jgi:exo-beta-1,3-glucanase (GH17 family)
MHVNTNAKYGFKTSPMINTYYHINIGGTSIPVPPGVDSIGVCYGMSGNDLPPPSTVIKMYKSNDIKAIRIYAPVKEVLEALCDTNITVLVGAPNDVLSNLTDAKAAAAWVHDNIEAYPSVSFGYIAIGNEVFGKAADLLVPAMNNVHSALDKANLGHIKVTTSVSQAIAVFNEPSAANFTKEAKKFMRPVLKFLSRTDAPLMANIYPYFTYAYNTAGMDVEYALFTAPGTVVKDADYNYQNLFDATVDAFYEAMAKLGVSDVPLLVSETGWPSGGGKAATPENAKIYNENLIEHIRKGTPRHPEPIETYVFSMFNENEKEKGVERNWGLFYPSMKPVYPISCFSTLSAGPAPAPAPALAPVLAPAIAAAPDSVEE